MDQVKRARCAGGTIIKRITTEMALVMRFTSSIQLPISPCGARRRNKLRKEREARLKEKEKAKMPRQDGRRMNALIKKTANGSILATSLEAA